MSGRDAESRRSAGIVVADASAVVERLTDQVRPVAPGGEPPAAAATPAPAREQAERLWPVTADRPLRRGPEWRKAVSYPVKRVLRKLMRWYVVPFVDQQRAFNAAVLRLVDELSEARDSLVEAAAEARSRQGALEQWLETEAPSLRAEVLGFRSLGRELEERLLRFERRQGAPGTVAAQPRADAFPDYFAFEARMRGDTEEIEHRQRPYVEDFRSAAPVLDLGCGRGELLRLLRNEGVEARGVDADADMVAYARGEGLQVEQADAVAALERVEDGSLGGIFAAQLLEHLPPASLLRLLELAASKLRTGGVLVAETINPLSPLALRNYFADLTHAQPLVPETLELLVRQAGFSTVEKRFLNEPEERLTPPEDPVLAANVARLNELLFGPLDYAIVARV